MGVDTPEQRLARLIRRYLITDEVVRAAATTVRSGIRVPLRQNGIQAGLVPGRVNPLHSMIAVNWEMFGPNGIATSDDIVTMGLQAGTHWDALTHVSYGGRVYNGRPAESVTTHLGVTVAVL
ncbi:MULTISPECIES: cyclase family protein [unclassified Nocardia]|uniref:cyclase family protein n=1 Tax=unclassified Nocardia TaxID=2637762 RepID=UPI001CE4055C|nr:MULTISPECIES: cyclase family protein [unclassified Nocardia]